MSTLPAGLEYKTMGHLASLVEVSMADGSIPGVMPAYVAVTGVLDEVGDIIEPGAFTRTLAKLEPKMALGHDWNRPIGMPEVAIELMPGDPRLPGKIWNGNTWVPWPKQAGALYTKNRYMLDTQDGRDAYAHAKFYGHKTAYSIGYVVTRKRFGTDPLTGKSARFIGDLDLYEYGPVLHGAHPLARQGSKSAQPGDYEDKVRFVRSMEYWGLPVGTPISPGMKPRGPVARQHERQGRPVDENLGVVEIDPAHGGGSKPGGLRIKPTAKGKAKRTDGTYESDILGLFDIQVGGKPYPNNKPDPYDDTEFTVGDTQGVNKGEDYNPLDMLIANGVTPYDLENQLRGADWTDRQGQADDPNLQAQVDSFISDTLDAYKEKYNAELVRQNSHGHVDDVAEADATHTAKAEAAQSVSTTRVASMGKAEAAAAAKGMSPEQLAAHHDELTARVTALGKDGQQSPAHQAIAAELATRQSAPDTSVGAPDGTPAPNVHPVSPAPANGAATPAPVHKPVPPAAPITPPAPAPAHKPVPPVTPPADGPITAVPADTSPQGHSIPPPPNANAPQPGTPGRTENTPGNDNVTAPPAETPSPVDGQTDTGVDAGGKRLALTLADGQPLAAAKLLGGESQAYEFHGATSHLRVFQNEGSGQWSYDVTGPTEKHDINGNLFATPEEAVQQGERDFHQLEDSIANPDGAAPPVPAAGHPPVPGEVLSPNTPSVPGPGHIPAPGGAPSPGTAPPVDAGAPAHELGTVLGDNGQPLPNVPINDQGDHYDPHGNLIGGSTQFDQAQNQATDALTGGDPQALAAALAPFGQQLQGDPQAKADELLNMPREQAIAQVQAWVDAANGEHATGNEADRSVTQAEITESSDGALADEAARLRGVLVTASASGQPATDYATRDAAMRLRVVNAELARRAEENPPEQPPALPTPEATAVLAAEEIADGQDVADASHGITLADDGEFEVEPDVADRQDRIAGLITQADAGALDLSGYSEDGLRTGRADVVSELRLQDYLAARQRQDRVVTRQQQENADNTPGETTGPDGAPAAEPAGPKSRPGVAGAAEDLADALESGDQDQALNARAQLDSSLRRSQSTSDSVAGLRALLESGTDPTPEQLRAAAEAIRIETRAKRNEQARNRRRARRFERDRLRSLLGDFESAMTGRGLTFDAVPETGENVDTPTLGTPAAGTWTTSTEKMADWLGYSATVDEVSGSHYTASVTTTHTGKSTYAWEVTKPDGTTVSGGGDVSSTDEGKAALETILQTQQSIGNLPADSVLPQTVVTTSSATPHTELMSRLDAINGRLTESGGKTNPLTGMPDPLSSVTVLAPPVVAIFDSTDQVRQAILANVARMPQGDRRDRQEQAVRNIRWDDVHLSPGGGLAVFSTAGQSGYRIMHTGTGLTIMGSSSGGATTGDLGKADLIRYAAILESLPDETGRKIDLSQDDGAIRESMRLWKRGDDSGSAGLMKAAFRALTAEKLRAGQWSSPLIKATPVSSSAWNNRTNNSRAPYVGEKTTALLYMMGNSKDDKATKEAVKGSWALVDAGAPDAAAVLLTRRAAELREQYGSAASDRGAALLDDIATGVLSMWSPESAPGGRALSLRTGERVTVTEGDNVRTYRAVTDMRTLGAYGGQNAARVVDESNGAVYKLHNYGSSDGSVLALSPATGHGNPIWTVPLGGDQFVVTDAADPIPQTAEDVRAANLADVQTIPPAVLDAAAARLPESTQETTARRATAPAGGRAPRKGTAAAPRRKAPVAPEEAQPVVGEQHLAAVQARVQPTWLGATFTLEDKAPSGGFTSVDEWRSWMKEERARYAGDPAKTRNLDVVDGPNYETVTLSPGGHLLITKDNMVVHARSTGAVWGTGPGYYNLTDSAKPSPATSKAVADYLERAVINGQRFDWSTDINGVQAEAARFQKAAGVSPQVAPARAAYASVLISSKKPLRGELDAFTATGMTGSQGVEQPNPAALGVLNLPGMEARYRVTSGGKLSTSVPGATGLADSKAGATLAKRVENEVALAQTLAKVAPLDAVRRLNLVADELGDTSITTVLTGGPGETLTPADDLRAIAKGITDAYDETKISPTGLLRRANYTGMITPSSPPEITSPKGRPGDPRAAGLTDRLRGSDSTQIRVWRDADGHKHASFSDVEISEVPPGPNGPNYHPNPATSGPVGGTVTDQQDGTLTLTWPDAATRMPMRMTFPPGGWEFEPEKTVEPGVTTVPDGNAPPVADGNAPPVADMAPSGQDIPVKPGPDTVPAGEKPKPPAPPFGQKADKG